MSAKDGADAQPDVVAAVQQGYSFDGPALELGALVVDGKARPDAPVRIPLAMVNRHGLVAGATGTGKTKTLQLMAEQLSAAGAAGEVDAGAGGAVGAGSCAAACARSAAASAACASSSAFFAAATWSSASVMGRA